MILQRVFQLLSRKNRAIRLGIEFPSAGRFKLPDTLLVNGSQKSVILPEETGVKVAFIDVILDDCYGLKNLSKPIHKVLDIGAHVGLFSLAARNMFPQAIIHAYEPNKYLEKYLKNQADAAGFEYFMEAVGLEAGKVTLDLHEDSVQTRSKVDELGDIPQVAFRQAIDRLGGSIDIVKLDCEGAEWQIFQDRDAWQSVQNLSMEYHLWPDRTHDQVREVVQNLGFKIKKQIPITDYGLLLASR
ncbi:FkbM family methyltransferase [Argonema galeatum]|uniref:FkbM family methyltransferase n=1 Tax=Argonema galeatum TaxID=2942762 RepID=UPI0020112046|nr:FkbM family methyltransferase [Argonema galeatum]MCL1468538.1 FkbM family methyltransferase [Argonema galeatum A003/A1]